MRKFIGIVLGSAIAAAGVYLLLRPAPPLCLAAGTEGPSAASVRLGSSGKRTPAGAMAAGVGVQAAASGAVVDLPEAADGSAGPVQVRADRVLATVNGNSIGLKNLVALEPNEAERMMTREEYQSRLDRAIEMELTFQAAAAQGVVLSAEQQARVEGLASKRAATQAEYKQQGFTWSSATVAQTEFEKRLTAALLLQQNMVGRTAAAAPSADAAAQARYEQARREILASLRTKGDVSVTFGVR